MLRGLLLYLSRHPGLRRWAESSRAAGLVTRRFVAGRTLDQALAVCRRLNRQGLLVTLDRLGENVTSGEEASAAAEAYLEALDHIEREELRSTVSVKLTQFGLDLSAEICRRNLERVVARAAAAGTSVEVDMEASPYVDRTLALVREMHGRHGHVRAVIQAYLRRSRADLEMLCGEGIPVRLCKGAYREPESVAFPRKKEVNASFRQLTEILLLRGVYPGLATHDPRMIAHACRFAREHGIAPERFEFQMLYGIRRDLQRRLVRAGYRLRIYVPYGEAWYPYLMRRLAERPANVLLVLRNLLRR
jgi:proline dehydrogenase